MSCISNRVAYSKKKQLTLFELVKIFLQLVFILKIDPLPSTQQEAWLHFLVDFPYLYAAPVLQHTKVTNV